MTIITKGMGAVLKSIKTLKKSKKFPGPKASELLHKSAPRSTKHPKLDIHERIGRTQRARDIMATKIRGFRKDKGKFTAFTGNVKVKDLAKKNLPKHHLKYGEITAEGPIVKVLKAGTKKKDLRKFKEFIKTGTRRK